MGPIASPPLNDPFFTEHGSFVIWVLISTVILLCLWVFYLKRLSKSQDTTSLKNLVRSMEISIEDHKVMFNQQNEALSNSLTKLDSTLTTLNSTVVTLSRDTEYRFHKLEMAVEVLKTEHKMNHGKEL